MYNYAVRKANEAMTVAPSIGKSLVVHYDLKTKSIGELAQNFEGEADPNRMTLGMKKWSWVKTQMNDGKITTPKKADVFTLTFAKDGTVQVTTDCNGMGGNYTTTGKKLTFSQMISTMMYCDGSQEQEFAAKLQDTASYMFTSKGELILEIKMDSGTMTFK
jgi:heat shock protein HslJ